MCHEAKGDPSKKDIRDRVAGSGVFGRTCDFRLAIDPVEADRERGLRDEPLTRNYPAREPFTVVFDPKTCTFRHSELLPKAALYGNGNGDDLMERRVVRIVRENPGITTGGLKTKIQVAAGVHESKARQLVNNAVEKGLIFCDEVPTEKGWKAKHYFVRGGFYRNPGQQANG